MFGELRAALVAQIEALDQAEAALARVRALFGFQSLPSDHDSRAAPETATEARAGAIGRSGSKPRPKASRTPAVIAGAVGSPSWPLRPGKCTAVRSVARGYRRSLTAHGRARVGKRLCGRRRLRSWIRPRAMVFHQP
jgi:hypothetical protein